MAIYRGHLLWSGTDIRPEGTQNVLVPDRASIGPQSHRRCAGMRSPFFRTAGGDAAETPIHSAINEGECTYYMCPTVILATDIGRGEEPARECRARPSLRRGRPKTMWLIRNKRGTASDKITIGIARPALACTLRGGWRGRTQCAADAARSAPRRCVRCATHQVGLCCGLFAQRGG